MRSNALALYIGFVALSALGVAVQLDWPTLTTFSASSWAGLAVFILLDVFSDYLSLPLVVGRSRSSQSISFILQFACVLVLGPAAATLVAAISSGVAELVARRGLLRGIFNPAQYTLATGLGGLAFTALGGRAVPSDFTFSFAPFLGFGLTVVLVNLAAVSVVLSLDQGLSVREVVGRLVGKRGITVLYDVLVAPFAVVIAVVYARLGAPGLLGTSFLLLWVRRSYLVSHQLQQANRDLLKALVKAIETRDPYTSGHSVRVAELASRAARSLNLKTSRIEDIETAALLHDVGKIDAIYSEILMKKGSLSHEEMEIIKSHVEKGVELLTSLSSFRSEVIAAVRHHHERFDGTGYPDGLSGIDIPLGARIIKICDAVDAMLSDRPYRKALAIPDVREQLLIFADREFDPQLVTLFLSDEVLERHSAAIRASLEEVAAKQIADEPSSSLRLASHG
ncbi:MAG: HD-GYP domain-containing protein [Gemmatimonadota bacterium]|nr:HD-GYP domain-containing protein [Gemmatimonadota bacterium]